MISVVIDLISGMSTEKQPIYTFSNFPVFAKNCCESLREGIVPSIVPPVIAALFIKFA